MSYAWQRWEDTSGSPSGISLTETTVTPIYFKEAYIAGVNVAPTQYGGLIPLVAVYKIDWQAYYNATTTG
jgi:hypothetical protein